MAMGWTAGDPFPAGSRDFSFLHSAQIDSGAQPASYPMDNGALSLRINRPEREADPSPPASAEVKKTWIHTSTPPYVFMV
jgi:hypothetical protein